MPDGQQYDASELDQVQHPTLGTLKFPKEMPYEERNSIVQGMERDQGFLKQAQAVARGAGESQRATMPVLPTPEPTGRVSRFLSGAVAGLRAMKPQMPDRTSIALSGFGPLPNMMRSAWAGFKQARDEGQGVLPSVASGAASLAGLDAPGIRERAKAGDVAGVIGEGVPAVTASLLGPKVIEKVPAMASTGAEIVKSPYRMAVKGQPPDFLVPEAPKAMREAIQPSVRIPKAEESIAIGGPRLQQVRMEQGIEIPEKGPEAIQAVRELNRQAKAQILDAIEQRMGPVAGLKPNASAVAKAIRSAVDDITLEREPGAKEAVERAANAYERDGGNAWTLRQMENRMHTLNNRLAGIYSQVTPGEARIPVEGEIALAEAKALRERIDSSVEELSGAGVKELKREYGAQRDIEKSLARQYAVATRQKGASLWPGLAALQIAGELASPKALVVGTVARMMKTLRDPGYLLNQSFHGPKAFTPAEPFETAPGPNIRGLLADRTSVLTPREPEIGANAPWHREEGPGQGIIEHPNPAMRFNPRTGPNEPAIDVEHFPMPPYRMASSGKTMVTPPPPVEWVRGLRELPAGPPENTKMLMRAARKALPPANPRNEAGSIEVGPSSEWGAPANARTRAIQEVENLHALWSELPRPGRFVHNAAEMAQGSENTRPDIVAYGIKSSRPAVEEMFPWVRDLDRFMSPSRIKAALEKGKGVDYERIVRAASEHLESGKSAGRGRTREPGED